MALATIEEAIQDYRDGKPVILVDDEDRENEGDLISRRGEGDAGGPSTSWSRTAGVWCAFR